MDYISLSNDTIHPGVAETHGYIIMMQGKYQLLYTWIYLFFLLVQYLENNLSKPNWSEKS